MTVPTQTVLERRFYDYHRRYPRVYLKLKSFAVRLKKIDNLSGSYRTMWITRFKRLNVCNYSFNKDIIERDLPKLFLQEK